MRILKQTYIFPTYRVWYVWYQVRGQVPVVTGQFNRFFDAEERHHATITRLRSKKAYFSSEVRNKQIYKHDGTDRV